MLSTLWKKINMGILAVVMSFAIAIIVVPVNSEATAKPKLSYTKTAKVGKTSSITIKNVKMGYYYKVTKTSGSVTTDPKVKKAKKISGKTATVEAVSKKTGTYKVTIQVYSNKKATKKVGKSITAIIKVREPSSLTLTGTSLYVGEKAQVKATLTNADSAKLTFKSENPDIATVDAKGKVTGIKAGKAVIVATCDDLTAKADVTVHNVNLGLKPEKAGLYVGQQVDLKASVKPASAKVTFSSRNPNIATVDAKGRVTGIKAGKATIVATCRNKTVKAYVTVYDIILRLNSNKVGVYVGQQVNLRASVTPASAKVTFSSENPDIATVDAKGKVTGIKAGKATIVATCRNKTVKAYVTVSDADLKLKAEEVEVCVCGEFDLKGAITVTPASAKLTFKSENPATATVDATGKVTGVEEGIATIVVTSGKKTVKVNVTVVYPRFEYKKEKVNVCVGEKTDLKDAFIIEPASAKLTFKSMDPATATVDAEGNVTGIKEGRTGIYVCVGTEAIGVIEVSVEGTAY